MAGRRFGTQRPCVDEVDQQRLDIREASRGGWDRWSMSGSRNHECRSSSRSNSSPEFTERLSWFHVSRATSSREQSIAARPFDPGAVQSETSTERTL